VSNVTLSLLLAFLITGTFLFGSIAAYGLKTGRVATEANSPPVDRRERPLLFWGTTLLYTVMAAGFAAGLARLSSVLLR
jgi:hypothetical protein